MVVCLERGADLHTAQLMQLPLTVSCFSKIQIGFTLVLAHLGSPGKGWLNVRARVCMCVDKFFKDCTSLFIGKCCATTCATVAATIANTDSKVK